MPRSSSRSAPSRAPPRRAATPPPSTRAAPPPAPAHHAPPPAYPQQGGGGGGMFSGLMGSVATGMAMGTGSAVAHRAVDGLMGPRTVSVEAQPAAAAGSPLAAAPGAEACGNQNKAFNDCLENYNDISKCQFYFDMLQQCKNGMPQQQAQF
eukprot:jgi/Chlat1/4277/Chrsp29S04367